MFLDAPTPSPEDHAWWQAHIDAANPGLRQMSQGMAIEHPAEIAEHALSAFTLYEVTPSTYSDANQGKVILYVHGGFTVGHSIAAAYAAYTLVGLTGLRTYSVDYRMLLAHPFPAELNDIVEAYRFLLERYNPEAIAGASASLARSCSRHVTSAFPYPQPAFS